MRKTKYILGFLILCALLVPISLHVGAAKEGESKEEAREVEGEGEAEEADMPAGATIDKQEYRRLRDEHMALLRGFPYPEIDSRSRAVQEMARSEEAEARRRQTENIAPAAPWVNIGPAPLPISQTVTYSGRVSAIAVHPTNPNIVYVGAAQGGLYRSVNGGTTWTPLLDGALSLAMGSIAISPSNPSTIYVGTGEAALSGDSYFGVGIYRIDNADSVPVITGPLNRTAAGADVFTGRSVSKIVVHPTDPNIIFATTSSGTAGNGGGTTGLTLPTAGLYRSINAAGASPTFTRLDVVPTVSVSRSMIDVVMEPGNPNRIVVGVIGAASDGGVYLTTDALAATPTFTRTLTVADAATAGRSELAINKVGDVVTVYAATGTGTGTVYKSVDGGATFNLTVDNNFCNPQCFYDIAIAVDPNDANKVYLGGSPTLPFGRSTNGGTSFQSNSTGLHVDTHAFAVAPSNPNIVYFGSDGGIWKTMDVTATPIVWQTLNNTTNGTLQFQSIALHPRERNYLLGGTQDNGTEFLAPDGVTWVRSDGGDGGYAQIDQNSPLGGITVAYHTYFNSSGSQIGFSRATAVDTTGDPIWTGLRGCGGTANGINCADSTLFYAPMVLGPGSPNTLYFGTNRVYRSTDTGTTMVDVSGTLPGTVSHIGVAPQDDNVRLAGLTTGAIYGSFTAGATTMTNITTAGMPARFVARLVVDPSNANIAYATFNGFGLAAGQHVWKTTNLLSGAPTWSASGTGIPDVPTNAFVIDPANPQVLFAGTDIGVFRSENGGASWQPFSEGLPRVAVFDMAIQPVHRVLRIATHGRGIYEMNLNVARRRVVTDFDGDGRSDVSVFRPSDGVWYLNRSTAGFAAAQFGISTDRPVPGDYDGDGKTDIAVYRDGNWYVVQSSNNAFVAVQFGIASDRPVQNDYDGDGKTDFGVYRNGAWYLLRSTGGFAAVNFGIASDTPVPSDFDGDGKADIAVHRPSDSATQADFYVLKSSDNSFYGAFWGSTGDVPVIGDYDGDTRADIAVFRPSLGDWYVLRSSGGVIINHFGQNGDTPVPGDYDGDAKTDQAVFRNGSWYILNSSSGVFNVVNFGVASDIPLPSRQTP